MRRLVMEKVPLVAIAVAFSIVALEAQRQGGAVPSFDRIGLAQRFSNVAVSYERYLEHTLWPAGLSAYYPWPPDGWPAWIVVASAASLLAATAVAIRFARDVPWLVVGWLWFAGTLVPVIGIVQIGAQAMADRYAYWPSVGLFIAIVWTVEHVLRRAMPEGGRTPAIVGSGAIIVALAAVTVRDVAFWRNTETLFRRAIALSSDNARAHHILSQELEARGALDEALLHARTAVVLDETNPRTHKNLGYISYRAGRVDEAIAELETAISLDPEYAEAHGNLAFAYARKGWTDRAMKAMARELELKASQPRP